MGTPASVAMKQLCLNLEISMPTWYISPPPKSFLVLMVSHEFPVSYILVIKRQALINLLIVKTGTVVGISYKRQALKT